MTSVSQIPIAPQTLRMLPAARVESVVPSPEPRWVREHWIFKAIASYVKTAWAFTRAPYESGRAWANGERDFGNPGDVLFQIMALLGPWYAFTAHVFHEPSNVWTSVRHAKTALIGVFAIGTMIHIGYRLLGSKRRLMTSWGAAILALGGLPVPVLIVLRPVQLWLSHRYTTGPAAGLVTGGIALLVIPFVFGPVAVTLAGVHKRSRASAVLLMITAMALAGIAISKLEPIVTPILEHSSARVHSITD
jgi:hypothetical protein